MPPIVSAAGSEKEIYYIAVIDILSRYGVRKKVAHLLKARLWEDAALSTVPADYYAERYFEFVDTILVTTDKKKKKAKKKRKKSTKSCAQGKTKSKVAVGNESD
eukprot:TRINITY_DN10382_c0_g1_i3.p2 TRINITY_DN10382_c0_g1~~TRINITY_DN10382_c0_g1_i3.p2  ORF type:complete len:104 (-),score=25.76 TRINITY_DN10382_c0_g1_i3:45-356(-)